MRPPMDVPSDELEGHAFGASFATNVAHATQNEHSEAEEPKVLGLGHMMRRPHGYEDVPVLLMVAGH